MQVLRPLPVPSRNVVHLREAVNSALEGKPAVVELALVALLAGGHLLIEDVPGVGKTTLARALAQAIGGDCKRVQFTSDLLPSDILGVTLLDKTTDTFVLRRGPIFTNILLADEINRGSPRTQSALLEAMSERQVTIDGQTIPLPDPFFVVATQNSQDSAGTFPLPESQLDRFFMRIKIGYPPPNHELNLLQRTSDPSQSLRPVVDLTQIAALQRQVRAVTIESSVADYLLAVVNATRGSTAIAVGVSPRGTIALGTAARARALLSGREFVIPEDILQVAVGVIAHRVRFSNYAEGYAVTRDEAEATISEIVSRISVPV